MEKQSLRDDNSMQMSNSFRGQNQSSSEVNQQIGQIALRLKHIGISESEQISVLQQIIIIAASDSDSPNVARDSGVIEAASTLLGQSQSTRVKGLDAPTSCPSLWVGHLKTKKAGMDANQDHS
ncbi:MAG: hypothetical protein EZS28_039456, partial [Streblomastix strix]